MQKKYHFFRILVALISIVSLSGCAGHLRQNKPGNGDDYHHIEKDYSVSFDTKGNIVVKDGKGRRVVKDKDKSVFPIKSSRIHSITTYTIVHFEGSDCIAIKANGKTDSYCFTH